MTIITWTYPDGTEGHPVLPRTWRNISGITPENASRLGFSRVETEVPDPEPEPKRYSKLRLYDALVASDIWSEVKTAIEEAGQWERWNWANDLATDYAPFALLLARMRSAFGDELVDAVLAQAEI